jgi:hypothetical protein
MLDQLLYNLQITRTAQQKTRQLGLLVILSILLFILTPFNFHAKSIECYCAWICQTT